VDLGQRRGAFADRRCDALGQAAAEVADREHAGEARLERKGASLAAQTRERSGEAGDDEALGVATRSWSHAALGSAPMNNKRWRTGRV
jgi:hypothetical protein